MSILTRQTQTERTKDQIKADVANTIAKESQEFYETLVRRYNDVMNKFWNHQKLTPQEICDALGTDAKSLFDNGTQLATMILTIKPTEDRLKLPEFESVKNSDGSVVITETPFVV